MSAPGTDPASQYPPGRFASAQLTYLEGGPVSFGEAVKQAFRNGFVYRGRASRSAFWWFALFLGTAGFAFAALWFIAIPPIGSKGTNGGIGAILVNILLSYLPLFYLELVALALLVRRLRETNRSGWWVLIACLPGGGIVLLGITLRKGTPEPNQYQP